MNGREVGTLACRGASIHINSGPFGPSLPWKVELFLADGTSWHSIDLDGADVRSKILGLFDEGVLEFPPTDPVVFETMGSLPCADQREH